MIIATAELNVAAAAMIVLGGTAAGAIAIRCAQRCFGVRLHRVPAIALCIAIAAALAMRTGSNAYLAPMLAFGWAGVLISGIDLRTHLIPTRLLRATTAVAVALLCVAAVLDGGLAGLARACAAAAIGAALGWGTMHVVWRAARGGLGYGDVRLGGYLGLHLGLGGLTAVLAGLLAGFAIAAVVGAVGVIVLGRSTDHRFALGPSLVAGAFVVIWWSAPAGLAV